MGLECRLVCSVWKLIGRKPHKLKINLPHDLAILFFGIHPAYSALFTTTRFTNLGNGNSLNILKLKVSIYTEEYYSAVKKKNEGFR